MDVQHVPAALEQKLGAEATLGLVGFVDRSGREWKESVMSAATDRFERRLVEETSGLRLQMADMESRLLKWSFVFWIGQVMAMMAIMSVR